MAQITDEAGGAAQVAPAMRLGARRAVLMASALLAFYVVLSLFGDVHGFLGTDTGGKVATLRAMDAHSTLVPDVHYWAAANDPTAELHPLMFTSVVDGHFVNVSTLPMLVVSEPLYRLGGYRLALLLPMLGAIACAFAARALALRLGSRRPDNLFWLVGIASPVVIYALDFWEHAPGLACVLWAIVLLLDAADEPKPRLGRFAAAGLLFGIAGTMRTEAFVYGLVATAVVLGYRFVRKRAWDAVVLPALVALGAVIVPFLANSVLERVLLGSTLRTSRTGAGAAGSGSTMGLRVKEAVTTTVGMNFSSSLVDRGTGCLFVVLLGVAVWGATHGWARRRVFELTAGAALVLAVRIVAGPAFVSGMLPAFPAAIAGLVLAWRSTRGRLLGAIALAALPIVWLTDWTGGAGPQWGGRYVLATSVVLGVVGLAALWESAPRLAWATAAMCVIITLLGVVNLAQRSHDVARLGARLTALRADVVIGRDAFLLREEGAYYNDTRPWLNGWTPDRFAHALDIARERGAHTVAVFGTDPAVADAELTGWQREGTQRWGFLGSWIYVTGYTRG
jgi:hypothetical protein